jgi:ribosomal protein S18 acetylase RimI-like enzyme
MTTVRRAVPADAEVLAAVAAVTFPLACPPHTTDAAKAAFIAGNLTEPHFAGYLADPARELLVAELDGVAAGYVMLVFAEPTDPDVAAAITTRPTVELSKFYVMPDHHGGSVSAPLMSAALDAAQQRKAAAVWLGVNEENERANRFYEKNGFARVGTKHFLVGDRYENDYVRERNLS